nr:MAG TPA: Head tail connector [Bacteriophage sp.]
MSENDLNLIEDAFSSLERHKWRFLECERAFRAVYKEDNRTSKRKNSQKSRSKLYVPLIKTTIAIIHAIFKTSFMSDRCPIEVTRVGLRSEHDLILQNALTAVLKNHWKKKEHRVGLSKAVLSALYLPLGIVSLFYDKAAGQIRTKFIPITDLAFDKRASDINDIEYVAYKYTQSVREVKHKLDSGFYKKKANEQVLSGNAMDSERVVMKELYKKAYENQKVIWKLKTYANSVLVREADFSRLPFHFGYCIEDMPSIDEFKRGEENAVYGSCVPEMVKEIQEEYNIKRNQKIDIIENQIDPQIAINSEAGSMSVDDLMARKKVVRVATQMGKGIGDVIQVLSQPSSYGLSEEIAMLKSEYEITTGVNSVMTGQTSPSDRRAMGALQTVNAASSMRIESMMQTLLDTMLQSYAEHFVWLIYRYTSDEELISITEDQEIIQKIGSRDGPLDFDINVNFGTTIANEVKIGQLNGLLGVLAQTNMNAPQITAEIIKQILTLILGENAPIEAIDQAMQQMQEVQAQQQAMIEQAALSEADTDDKTTQDEESEQDLDMQALLNGGV